MYIHEAVKKAMEIDGYVTVGEDDIRYRRLFIKPTNGNDCCILCQTLNEWCRRWQPYADELMSDAWRVATKEEFLYPSINRNIKLKRGEK